MKHKKNNLKIGICILLSIIFIFLAYHFYGYKSYTDVVNLDRDTIRKIDIYDVQSDENNEIVDEIAIVEFLNNFFENMEYDSIYFNKNTTVGMRHGTVYQIMIHSTVYNGETISIYLSETKELDGIKIGSKFIHVEFHENVWGLFDKYSKK